MLYLRLPPLAAAVALLLATPSIAQTAGPPAGSPSGTASPGGSDPDMTGATVVRGTLADGDATRPNGQPKDGVARVRVLPGQTLITEMTSETFDTYLILEAVGGEQLAYNDDYRGSVRRSVARHPNRSRTVEVVLITATAYSSSHRGDYTVRYVLRDNEPPTTSPRPAPPPPQPPPAASGATLSPGTVRGTVPRSAERMEFLPPYSLSGYVEYAVTLRAGEAVTFQMDTGGTYQNGGMLSSKMNLGFGNSFVATSEDVYPHVGRSRLEFTPTTSGTYRLFAGTDATRFGGYSLTFEIDE